jgi:hypothetical protein
VFFGNGCPYYIFVVIFLLFGNGCPYYIFVVIFLLFGNGCPYYIFVVIFYIYRGEIELLGIDCLLFKLGSIYIVFILVVY